jgi:hypothetical protein
LRDINTKGILSHKRKKIALAHVLFRKKKQDGACPEQDRSYKVIVIARLNKGILRQDEDLCHVKYITNDRNHHGKRWLNEKPLGREKPSD